MNLLELKATNPNWLDMNHNDTQDRAGFFARLAESTTALGSLVSQGYDHWIITFSGGKDSTTTLIIALEAALNLSHKVHRIDLVYSDTQVEIPVIKQYALDFLSHLKRLDRLAELPLVCHVVSPAVEESFWVCLLGKGYPPPHQQFRWCTQRLKIRPAEKALKSFAQPNRTVVLTGVRFGESRNRDNRLRQSCSRGGECGQGVWLEYSPRLQAMYLAPIVDWRECDVWDFLNFYAPQLGYPTEQLERGVYNGRETRFGCWMCTVVRQDKAMEKITSLPQWLHLKPLFEFRKHVKEIASQLDSRVLRSNGKPGRLTLEVRKILLDELLELQKQMSMTLISQDEEAAIRRLWQEEKYG